MEIKYFENENVEIQINHAKDQSSTNDTGINEKYQKGEIRIVTEQARYPLNTIAQMTESENYILRPEFQRRHRWDRKKQSLLIESFIMNIPIPPIFLYEKEFSYYEVMDGLQRMTAISDFYNDKYALTGLEYWKELEGRKYSTLPEKIKRGIDRRYLSSIILLNETAKSKDEADKLKQLVFDRINSGGVKLEPQESRNAFYPGPFNKLTIDLARNRHFCMIFNIPQIPDNEEDEDNEQDDLGYEATLKNNLMYSTMKDVELVLRFFAVRHIKKFEDMSLKNFLDNFLKEANKFDESVLKQYEKLFNDTIELVYNIYGENAFRLLKYNQVKERWITYSKPAIILYDPIMFVLSQQLDKSQILIEKKDEIVDGTSELYRTNESKFNGRNTNRSNIIERIDLFEDFFNGIIND